MLGYIVDYQPEGSSIRIEEFGSDKDGAVRFARRMSRAHGSAYVISYTGRASAGDYQQHGQAVFVGGMFSHYDEDFDALDVAA